jgi:hypothetical protein
LILKLEGIFMKKFDVINAELTRLHATYSMLIEKATTASGLLNDEYDPQLTQIQDKIAFIHDVLDKYDDGDGYPISDLMYDDSDEDAN